MKLAILIGAALLGATGVVPDTADAQRYGYHDRQEGRGWRSDRGWRGDRGFRDGRGWRGDRGWRDGRRWDRGGYRARGRVVCRVQRGYYGPVRRCVRIYR